MIFAEKLIKLRKQQGWSQEDLADKLGVSRQSVSKWESMSSVPDLERIVKLSRIFDVSTDYLLRDDVEEEKTAAEPSVSCADAEPPAKAVSVEEANSFLKQTRSSAFRIALGVFLCIICPVPSVLLGTISEQPGSALSTALAEGIGTGSILVLVAAAVGLFIMEGFHLKKYEYLDSEPIVTEYGVAGIAERRRENYEPCRRRAFTMGVLCCILAVVPLVLAEALFSENKMLEAGMISVLFVFVAAGVFLLVWSSTVRAGYDRLLEEGAYSRENKQMSRRNRPLTAIYWCLATAVYLAWSFITMDWSRTWIVWPVAGVLFGAIVGIADSIRKNRARY